MGNGWITWYTTYASNGIAKKQAKRDENSRIPYEGRSPRKHNQPCLQEISSPTTNLHHEATGVC